MTNSLPRGGQEPLPGLEDEHYHDDGAAWLPAAIEAIARLVAVQPHVTADDLRQVIPPPPSAALWGRAWSTARRSGIIAHSGGYRRSSTPSRRHGANAVWRGTSTAKPGAAA